ncbi:unnamed protein product [Debaryomyces fabryi]|nr:unnamed protein product [Debaryomyces fabryi]
MIRTSVRRVVVNSNKFDVRSISNSSIRFTVPNNQTPPPVKVPTTPVVVVEGGNKGGNKGGNQGQKKKFSLTGLLFKTAFWASVVYGGTLFVATKNDKVMDFIIDKQPPYYEELLNVIEHGSIEDLKKQLKGAQQKISDFDFKFPSKAKIDEFTHELESRGENLIEETKKKLGTHSGVRPRQPVSDETSAPTPAEQLQKPVETVHRSVEHLPLIQLDKGIASSVDSSIKSTIKSFNDLILSIDAGSHTGSKNESLIREITENVSKLSSKLNSLTLSFDEELQSKLKISQSELLSSYTKKELELTENLLHQFHHEKAQMEKKLGSRLNQEIEATKQTISQAAVNAVSMMRVEQTKNFEKLIKDKIDQERDGRLANLEKLNSRVTDLENFSTALESQLVTNHQKSLIQQSLTKLKTLLLGTSSELEKPRLISPYVENLAKISSESNDELIALALQDLQPLLSRESTHSILSTPQLLTRWEQLVPELRSASLLPPNAGLLGHLSSMLFSKLLFPVKGAKPDGKDIESVIGRVESSLARGELDVAVEEVANLKGWSRKLADDWVKEGRKRLEIEFLMKIIDAESKIL